MTDCIEWQGKIHENGYGLIYNPKTQKHERVHRWVVEQEYGPIPEDKIVMHTCDNRKCYNLEHLKIATQSDNLKDMYQKGRQGDRDFPKGEAHHFTTLTEEQVQDIKLNAVKGKYAEYGRKYGVTRQTIGNIKRGKTWNYQPADLKDLFDD